MEPSAKSGQSAYGEDKENNNSSRQDRIVIAENKKPIFKRRWFWVILAIGILILATLSYAGVSYAQAKRLVREGDRLMKESQWEEALRYYNKAEKKFIYLKKEIDLKITEAKVLEESEDNIKLGQESFDKGEWQKCLDYLVLVSSKHPKYSAAQERYSDCEKKLDEEEAAAVAETALQQAAASDTTSTTPSRSSSTDKTKSSSTSSSSSSTSSPSSSSSSSSGSESSDSSTQTQAKPVLYLPFTIMPPRISPMGETLYHGGPIGHPGIDFIWPDTADAVPIIASMDVTITAIRASEAHAGAYDVTTQNGIYGADYTEMGSTKPGLQVGDAIKVGDLVGYAYHPSEITDQPNYKMIHWQFGYEAENPEFYNGVANRLCPTTYFSASAESTIESLWATTDWSGVDMKGNAPNICSGYYAGRDR